MSERALCDPLMDPSSGPVGSNGCPIGVFDYSEGRWRIEPGAAVHFTARGETPPAQAPQAVAETPQPRGDGLSFTTETTRTYRVDGLSSLSKDAADTLGHVLGGVLKGLRGAATPEDQATQEPQDTQWTQDTQDDQPDDFFAPVPSSVVASTVVSSRSAASEAQGATAPHRSSKTPLPSILSKLAVAGFITASAFGGFAGSVHVFDGSKEANYNLARTDFPKAMANLAFIASPVTGTIGSFVGGLRR